jgi:hypothetical protein
MLRRVSGTGIGTDIGLVTYRDLAIAISRRYLRPKKTFHRDRSENDEDDDRDEKTETMTADEQAGHTLHVAGMMYARRIMTRDGKIASKRERFRTSSVR